MNVVYSPSTALIIQLAYQKKVSGKKVSEKISFLSEKNYIGKKVTFFLSAFYCSAYMKSKIDIDTL